MKTAVYFVTNPDPMQTNTATPAESLLQRLLHSERIETDYAIVVEKKESFTNVFIRLINSLAKEERS